MTGTPVAAGPVVEPLPLEVTEFLTWLAVERGRAQSTLAAYGKDLRWYLRWLRTRGTPLAEVGSEDLEQYVAVLRSQQRAPATVARAMVAVRSLHRFLAAESGHDRDPADQVAVRSLHRFLAAESGHDRDPADQVAVPGVPAGLPRALTEAEVGRLLAAVVGNEPVHRRDRAILEVLYGTGMRISELVGLDLADLDLAEGLVRVFGKGSKERIVPLGRYARAALVDWLSPAGRGACVPARWARRGDAEAVFLNLRGGRLTRQGAWGVVRQYADRVGLGDRLSPHVLRHSCATHLVERGADIRVVQELLGHASISTTQVYTRVTTERLRAVYDAAHPRARHRPARGREADG